jgi:hypothetical protein
MRRILICTGVLGGGTALVFTLAAATAMLFPQGALVSGGWNGDMRVMGVGGGVVFGGGVMTVPGAPGLTVTNDVVVVGANGAPIPVAPVKAPLPAPTDRP